MIPSWNRLSHYQRESIILGAKSESNGFGIYSDFYYNNDVELLVSMGLLTLLGTAVVGGKSIVLLSITNFGRTFCILSLQYETRMQADAEADLAAMPPATATPQ